MNLPLRYRIDNIILLMATPWTNPVSLLALLVWVINTWKAQYTQCRRKQRWFWPALPKTISITHNGQRSAMQILEKIRQYGISPHIYKVQFDTLDKRIILHFSVLVPGTQHWMADVVLRWFAKGDYVINSPSVTDKKRGNSASYAAHTTPWRPWGVRAKARSFDQAIGDFLFGWALK